MYTRGRFFPLTCMKTQDLLYMCLALCPKSALPGLVDQKEITAALRQCNYDPEEVISAYLTMFGEILLQASLNRDPHYTDLNSFRYAMNSNTETDSSETDKAKKC